MTKGNNNKHILRKNSKNLQKQNLKITQNSKEDS